MCFIPLSKNGFRRILLDGAVLVGILERLRLDPLKNIGDSGSSIPSFSPVMQGRPLFLCFGCAYATGARAPKPACWWCGRTGGGVLTRIPIVAECC